VSSVRSAAPRRVQPTVRRSPCQACFGAVHAVCAASTTCSTIHPSSRSPGQGVPGLPCSSGSLPTPGGLIRRRMLPPLLALRLRHSALPRHVRGRKNEALHLQGFARGIDRIRHASSFPERGDRPPLELSFVGPALPSPHSRRRSPRLSPGGAERTGPAASSSGAGPGPVTRFELTKSGSDEKNVALPGRGAQGRKAASIYAVAKQPDDPWEISDGFVSLKRHTT